MRLADLLHAHDDLGFIAMQEELIDVSWVAKPPGCKPGHAL
jgi:hypothetical protein